MPQKPNDIKLALYLEFTTYLKLFLKDSISPNKVPAWEVVLFLLCVLLPKCKHRSTASFSSLAPLLTVTTLNWSETKEKKHKKYTSYIAVWVKNKWKQMKCLSVLWAANCATGKLNSMKNKEGTCTIQQNCYSYVA